MIVYASQDPPVKVDEAGDVEKDPKDSDKAKNQDAEVAFVEEIQDQLQALLEASSK